ADPPPPRRTPSPPGPPPAPGPGRPLRRRQPAGTEPAKRAGEGALTRRRRSDSDRRVFLLELTEEGDERVTRAFHALRRDRAAFAEAFDRLGFHFRAATRN